MRTLISAVAVATALAGAATAVTAPAQADGRTPAHAHTQSKARPAWHVSIKASTTTGTVGKKVVITGKVARSAAGKLVLLQERPNAQATWKLQRDAVVKRDGTYQTHDTPTANKQRMYRVVMPATKNHRKGVSKSVVVDVYAWVSLMSRTAVNQDFVDLNLSVAMNGTTYPSSLQADVEHFQGAPTTESVEFNLSHRCTRFRSRVGLSDASATGSQATVSLAADGTSWLSKTYAVGQTEANRVDFATAPLKIRFESTSLNAGADGLGALGSPEVFCEG